MLMQRKGDVKFNPNRNSWARFRLPVYKSLQTFKAATAVTQAGVEFTIPIDDEIYDVGALDNDMIDHSKVCSGLSSRSESPLSPTYSPRQKVRDLKRTVGYESDSSDSYWPGDYDISDSELSDSFETPEDNHVNDCETGTSVSNQCAQPGFAKENNRVMAEIEYVIKGLIRFEDNVVTVNNSALESKSEENTESLNAVDKESMTKVNKDYVKNEDKTCEKDNYQSNFDLRKSAINNCETDAVKSSRYVPSLQTTCTRIISENEIQKCIGKSTCMASNNMQPAAMLPLFNDQTYVQTMVVDENGLSNVVNVPESAYFTTRTFLSPGWCETECSGHNESTLDQSGEGKPFASEKKIPESTAAFPAKQNHLNSIAEMPLEMFDPHGYLTPDNMVFTKSYHLQTPEIYHEQLVWSETQLGDIVELGQSPVADTCFEVGEMTPLDQGFAAVGPNKIIGDSISGTCRTNSPETDNRQRSTFQQTGQFQHCVEQGINTNQQIPAFIDPEDGLLYPALHLTDDGLITVILRRGVFLEMTPEKAMRLVNHEKKLVVAMNNNGTRACVIHPAARVCQVETTVNAELYFGRKAKMTTEMIMFGNKFKTYKFDYERVTEVSDKPSFRDLSQDESVFFLETSSGFYNNDAFTRCQDIMSRAYFHKHQNTGSKIIINGAKIVQNDNCDVSVYIGAIKSLKMNSAKSVLRLKTQFVEIDIEANWNIKIVRGSHMLTVSHLGFVVSNGKIKASLDNNTKFQAFSLPEHRCLMLGQPLPKRRPGFGQLRHLPAGCKSTEPEGDHAGYQLNQSSISRSANTN